MQHEGKPQFIHAHTGTVKGVTFSPRDQYIFCSGGTDGRINVYNALQGAHTMSTKMASPHAMKVVNAVKYNADGSRILAITSKRLSVIDAGRCDVIRCYDNVAFAHDRTGRGRSPLATDPNDPNLAICACTSGKGMYSFDLRSPEPRHFALNVHASTIRDIIYLDRSWPFGDVGTVASLSADGVCKVRTDDRLLDWFDVKHRSNCLTATPGGYHSNAGDEFDGFESVITVGGDCLSEYLPNPRIMMNRFNTQRLNDKPVNKIKYTSNGHILYAATSGGLVKRYRRVGGKHQLIGEVFSHDDGILDMDISHNDEYMATASRDGSVGLLCLGAPSFGWTGFMELA